MCNICEMKQILIYVGLMLLGLSSHAQTDAENLIGTWRLDSMNAEYMDLSEEEEELMEELKKQVYITFNADSTFNYPELDEDNPSSVLTGTYYLDKNNLVTREEGDDELEIIKYRFIQSNYLSLSVDGETLYFRKDE